MQEGKFAKAPAEHLHDTASTWHHQTLNIVADAGSLRKHIQMVMLPKGGGD